MQWKSFLLFVAIADLGLARLHGHQRRHKHNPAHPDLQGPEADLKARDLEVKTVVDLEVVTVTTTITGQPVAEAPAPSSSSSSSTTTTTTTTVAAAPAEITPAETHEDVISIDLGASIGVSVAAPSLTPSAESTAPTSTPAASTTVSGGSTSWTSTPSSGEFSTSGFGTRTNSSGSGIEYSGNVGSPWGSNIIEVSASTAYQYRYVVQFTGSNTEDWTIVFWNKIGPDGKMDGWYGHSALNLTLGAGETKYVAFDEDSQGGWGAAKGSSLPTDDYGGYSCTWGEFDFGSTINDGWSGWDVSAIQAQAAGQTVQGMKICNHNGETCSTITSGASTVTNAYTQSEASVDGIGGSLNTDSVRLVAIIDYSE